MALTLRDISGNGFDGTYRPAIPPASAPPPGVGRNARSFNSFLTDFEESADVSAVVPTLAAGAAVTIAGWCKPASLGAISGGKVPFALNSTTVLPGSGDINRAMIRFDTSDFPDRYAVIDRAEPISTGAAADPSVSVKLTWQFVAMRITPTALELVVNGTEVASKATSLAMPAAGDRLTIAGELDYPSLEPTDLWYGRLDEVKAFDYYVSDVDLALLTAIGLGAVAGDYRETALALGPVGYWTFDGGGFLVGAVAS